MWRESAAVINSEFITRWSGFSYEMLTNLWPGERSRARIQYHCLSASVFIRCFLSTVKGRLQCLFFFFYKNKSIEDSSMWTHWNISTLYRCDGLICCLFTGHLGLLWQADRGIDLWARLKPETGNDLSSPLSVLAKLTASGDCSQKWAATRRRHLHSVG